MGAIFRREMKAYFTSPVAYIFISVFFFYTGTFFVSINIYNAISDLSYVFIYVFLIMMIMLPILTMRLFAEERRQKTDQCLLTAPVSLFSIVFAKFAAALCVFLCAMSIFAFYLLALSAMGANIAWSIVWGSLIALLLLGGCFISIGVFVSSLTENQIVSAIVSIIAGFLFYMMDVMAGSLDSLINSNRNFAALKAVMTSLGLYTRYAEFSSGILNLESVVFFLSFIFVFIFLTVRVLEKRRWG
ncbi:MAG: ABC transporter permease [Oscillospiraceae bacterium]|nr:ABC transporter permease [Oscillospiraceae bacterium]